MSFENQKNVFLMLIPNLYKLVIHLSRVCKWMITNVTIQQHTDFHSYINTTHLWGCKSQKSSIDHIYNWPFPARPADTDDGMQSVIIRSVQQGFDNKSKAKYIIRWWNTTRINSLLPVLVGIMVNYVLKIFTCSSSCLRKQKQEV